MMCRENDVRLNTNSITWNSTLYSFGNFTIRQYDDSTNWHSTTWLFDKTTIPWNDLSGKWCGPDCKREIILREPAFFLFRHDLFRRTIWSNNFQKLCNQPFIDFSCSNSTSFNYSQSARHFHLLFFPSVFVRPLTLASLVFLLIKLYE